MRDILTRGLAQLGLPADAVPQLVAYAALLLEKNKVMNLTAITAPQEVATLHLLDCAALAAILEALTVIQEKQLPHRAIRVAQAAPRTPISGKPRLP